MLSLPAFLKNKAVDFLDGGFLLKLHKHPVNDQLVDANQPVKASQPVSASQPLRLTSL